MSGNSCFFIGHHDAPESIYPALLAQVERHITEYAVTDFFVGRYGSFDRMAARAVRTAKVEHPTVKLTLLLPYHPAGCKPEQAEDFASFDGTCYPAGLESVPRLLRHRQPLIGNTPTQHTAPDGFPCVAFPFLPLCQTDPCNNSQRCAGVPPDRGRWPGFPGAHTGSWRRP